MRWPTFNFIGIGDETGKETPIAAMIGRQTTEATTIVVRVEQRETTYKAGERIEAQTEDLEEVLHFFAGWAIPSMLTAFADFLKANGIGPESPTAPQA